MGDEPGFRVGRVMSRELNLYVPSATEGYFTALGAATAESALLGYCELSDLATRHAMRVTRPLLEGYLKHRGLGCRGGNSAGGQLLPTVALPDIPIGHKVTLRCSAPSQCPHLPQCH